MVEECKLFLSSLNESNGYLRNVYNGIEKCRNRKPLIDFHCYVIEIVHTTDCIAKF